MTRPPTDDISILNFPTIDDKRDVIDEIIQKEWNPTMTIFETIQLIPKFVSDVLLHVDQDEEIKSVGKWHLGQLYHITDWNVSLISI